MKKAIIGMGLAVVALGAVDVALAASGRERSEGCQQEPCITGPRQTTPDAGCEGSNCITAPRQEVPTKGCDVQPC